MNSSEFKLTIDASGLSCPLPLLKAKQGLNTLSTGENLLVIATDAGSERDVMAYIDLSPHTLIAFECDSGVYRYHIQKG